MATARVGRPREFDIAEALERAMRASWEHGHEGARLTDLTGAMGIGKPSLSAAFGDKRALFERSADVLSGGHGSLSAATSSHATTAARQR